MTDLRIAVVGLKGVGKGHVQALARHPRTDLVAVADVAADAAAQTAEEYGATAFTDYRELLDKEQLHAIVFATPHHLHAPMALDALEAGVHTFVEKPLAIRVSEGDRMVQTARDKEGTIVCVGDAAGQTRQVLENLKAVVEGAGGRMEDIAKTTVYITNVDDRPAVGAVRREFFKGDPPANTLLIISALAAPEFLVEIEAIVPLP